LHRLIFLRQFFCSPRDIGAVAPSSRALAELITEAAQVHNAATVVEFGPGTGAITEVILRKLRDDSQFFAFELNPRFVEFLRRKCPDVRVIHDCASNTRRHLEAAGLESCDCIVSGLPWAAFDEQLQDELLDAALDVLRPGGRFTTYAYLQGAWLPAGRRFRQKLIDRFAEVRRTRTLWWNLFPAFVYYATK